MTGLILKRATASRGIMRTARRHYGYAETREAAMAAFAKSWRRE